VLIESGHPFLRCQLEGLACFPVAAINQLSFVQAVDRFSEGVSKLSPRLPTDSSMPLFVEPLAIANADVLRIFVGVVYQRCAAVCPPRVKRLFKRIQNEVHGHRLAGAPANDAPSEYVNHERDVQPALPRQDVGEA
jgi:hypothetical protein